MAAPKQNIFASFLLAALLACGDRAMAVSPKEMGVRMATTVTVAASLASCRAAKGDGYDWLDFYLERLKADSRAIRGFMVLPNKIAHQRVQEIIDYFGSCSALLEYESSNGLKAFSTDIVPRLSRMVCDKAGGC